MTVNISIGRIETLGGFFSALDTVRTENVPTSTVAQITSVAAPDSLSPSERWGFIIEAAASAVYFSVAVSPSVSNTNANNVSRLIQSGGSASGILKKNEKFAVIKAGDV